MRVGSLFAGIGGFDLGFERAGFTLAWHAEIDRAASAILRYRWPDVPNLGDVTKIDGAAIEPVDVICGGFPCQDLSVAGKRAGFSGERSVLAFEFLRIVREMREATNGSAPTFIVLENVPGLFSSAGGRDFGALLDALGELGAVDIAWRVLDSRYFGVAQRRRRVFVVVDFGGKRAEEVLALREGLRGNPPSSRAAREDIAGTLGGGAHKGGWGNDLDSHGAFIPLLSPALKARYGKGPSSDGDGDGAPLVVTDTLRSHVRPGSNTFGQIVAHTLRAEGSDASEDGTGRGVPLVTAFDTTQITSAANYSRPQPGDPSHPLAAGMHVPAIAFNWQNGGGYGEANDGLAVTVEGTPPQSRSQVAAVAFRTAQTGANGIGAQTEAAYTLDGAAQGVAVYGVRRLTPRECERLQGFPDDWTAIPSMADGPRYKCLGNAVTVNVAEWIARRIGGAA